MLGKIYTLYLKVSRQGNRELLTFATDKEQSLCPGYRVYETHALDDTHRQG